MWRVPFSCIALSGVLLAALPKTVEAAGLLDGNGNDLNQRQARAGAPAEAEKSQPLTPAQRTVISLNKEGARFFAQGGYEEAERLLHRALAISEKALGPEHPLTATSLNNLGALYRVVGAYRKAEPLSVRAVAIREKVLGPEHPSTATSLNNLAALYFTQGAYEKAEPLYVRALAIKEKALGPEHLSTANSLNNLAALYKAQGAYGKAELLFVRASAIHEKVLGPEHPSTATSLNNLAVLYEAQGAYGKAELLYERTLATQEMVLGHEHPSTAAALNNLAGLYDSQGAYDKAEPLYLRALAIHEKALGPEHPDTATSLNNLAFLYVAQGAYGKAEPLYVRALAIKEKVLGREHPDTATSLNNLAGLYVAQGAYSKAEPLYMRALAIREKALGPEHPDTATSLNNLAFLYVAQGAFSKAEPLYMRALAIREKALGPEHLDNATSLNNLAFLYDAQGAYDKAEPLRRRGIGSQVLFLQREIPLLPQAQRQAQMEAIGNSWEVAFSDANRSASGAQLALFSRLNRHGLLLEIEKRQALLARDPAYRELRDRIAALTFRLADVNLSSEKRQELQIQRAQLEQQLYRQLPTLQPRLVQPEQVARALPAAGALVEFQRYQPFDGRQPEGKRWGEARYLALLLGADGTISATDLGTAAPIDASIREALAITQAGEIDPTPSWRQVSQAVFPAELRSRLSAYQRWFVSPDGELNRIPFAALPSPASSDQRLGETIQLRLITSGRDLVPLPQASSRPPSQQPVVLADPDFGGDRPWQRLDASAAEGQQISQQIGGRLYQRQQATTAALQRSISPKLLHVASHGYFSSPEAPKAAAQPPPRGSRSAFAGPPGSREDAMLNSGIVLAGANRSATPTASTTTNQQESEIDDGYLTAREAAQLQLEGTELVVLSACDTASGEQRTGEGVYGLQRGLTVAGARSTLLSLWKVDDAATAHFMRRYYTLLQEGKGRMEALLAVQQEFRGGVGDVRREWADAKYWAAWQLSGESEPLQGL